ncbi:hypothetical protein PHAVU_010G085800 [Phaseolus vulgaris]
MVRKPWMCVCKILLGAMVILKMAFDLYGMLAGNVSPMTGENVKPAYGGEEEAFLRKEVARSKKGRSKHSQWRNYDDLNEYFWSAYCFRLGWPMRVDADFFCLPSENSLFDKSNVVNYGAIMENRGMQFYFEDM